MAPHSARKRTVPARVRQQCVPARRVVQHRPSRAFQEERDLFSPFTQFGGESLTVQDAGDRGIAPHGLARPDTFRGKRREQPSVNGAAERDRVIGNGEDVLPERIAGPEGLHRGKVGAPARFDGIVQRGRRMHRCRSVTFALARRATTLHAATGIAAASAASVRRAFVPAAGRRMMCLSMAIQAAKREMRRPEPWRCAIDAPAQPG